jgi:CRP/FNR family transcriptional regulator, cyclic AMP receptor protein
MSFGFAAPVCRAPFEDLLAHLPVSSINGYPKGQIIYGPAKPSTDIYLVTSGKVKLSRIANNGIEVLLEIIRPDELFGQSGFLTVPHRSEQAMALENAKVMTWPISSMEDLVIRRPRLAVVLLQIFAQRTADFALRIESFAVDNIQRRLGRSLIHFSERLGTPSVDGSVRMMPLTHELLSQHIGTSREIVTLYMNQFRKEGYLRYSRQGIILYRDALAAAIVGTKRSGTVVHRPDVPTVVKVPAAAMATESN